MTKRILFGTDGIRGEANVHPMTIEVAMGLGRALAYLVREGQIGRPTNHRKRIVIGKDTRLSGYCFEQALAAGICSMGVDVMLVGPLPTPGIAFITQSMRADAGVVVSASHNPFEDNGIKIFGHDGFKLPDDTEKKLETLILTESLKDQCAQGKQIGKAFRIDDAVGRYVVYLKSLLPQEITLDGLKIVVDCAHGAAYKVAPEVFSELGAEVIATGVKPDGCNINQNVGSLFPQHAQKLVKESGAHLGIALDGDADRLVLIDETGEQVNGDAVIALLAGFLKTRGQLAQNTVVTTVMSNLGLEQCLAKQGVHVERTDVGDRYVVQRLKAGGFNFGGEESGHLIFLDRGTTGDGIIAALMIIHLMLEKKSPLSELKKVFCPLPRTMVNIRVPEKRPFHQLPALSALLAQLENEIAGNGRILMRYSGTEKKARILVEWHEAATSQRWAQQLADTLLNELTPKDFDRA